MGGAGYPLHPHPNPPPTGEGTHRGFQQKTEAPAPAWQGKVRPAGSLDSHPENPRWLPTPLAKNPLAGDQAAVAEVKEMLAATVEQARRYWWVFLLLGVVLVVGGVLSVAYPFVSSVAAVRVFGAVLVISGAVTIVGAFWAGRWSSLLLQILVGLLYLVAGIAIRDTPVESTAMLTLFAAAFFIVVGAFRVIVAVVERFPQWGWAVLNGLVTLLLGMIVYDTFPESALWLIGLMVGCELLFNGLSWVMLGLFLRRLPEEEEAAE